MNGRILHTARDLGWSGDWSTFRREAAFGGYAGPKTWTCPPYTPRLFVACPYVIPDHLPLQEEKSRVPFYGSAFVKPGILVFFFGYNDGAW